MRGFRLNVKRRYIISYLLIVLAVTVLLGAATISISVTEMRNTLYAEQRKRFELAFADMQTQIGIMNRAMLNIKISGVYQPYYKKQLYTHELELLEDLHSYETYLPYDALYYLIYREDDEIYFQDTKCGWDTLCKLYLGLEADAELREAAFESPGMHIMRAGGEEGENLLFFLPFEMGFGRSKENACLIFQVKEHTLKERLSNVSGLSPEEFTVYYGEAPPEDRHIYFRQSPTELFALALNAMPREGFERLETLLRIEYGICALILLIGSAIAVFMAVRQYKPIETLTEKVGGVPDGGSELTRIGEFIQTTVTENEEIKREIRTKLESLITQSRIIDRQAVTMRRQVILLMLLGVYRPENGAIPEELEGILVHRYFGVMNITFDEADGAHEDEHILAIESCSGKEYELCAVPFRNDSGIVALVNMADPDDMREVVFEVGKRLGKGAVIAAGEVVEDIGRISASYMQAANLTRAGITGGDFSYFDDRSYVALCEAVRASDAHRAEESAREFVRALACRQLPLLERRRAFIAVTERLKRMGEEIGAKGSEEAYIGMLVSLHTDAFEERLVQYVLELCGGGDSDAPANHVDAMDILNYVDEHACERDMSLTRLEDHFNISGKTVSAAVKNMTNLGFREYIIYRRIEHAKLMLLNTQLSIATIAEMSGYDNVSYFIKSFKNSTGKTPGQFQKDGM